MFGENLHLTRRIEADLGGDSIRIHDRVVNQGFYPTPHMLCYHLNLGYPLLGEGSRFVAPIADVVFASHAGDAYRAQSIGYRTAPAPQDRFREQVWEHDIKADDGGRVRAALVNDAIGLGFVIETLKQQLPVHYQWENFQAGSYALGIEPATNHIPGRGFAEERGELIVLGHGDERRYDVTLTVLDGAEAIAAASREIAAVSPQPDEDYPALSGRFAPLPA